MAIFCHLTTCFNCQVAFYVKATQAAADALGRRLIIVETATEDELAPAVARLAEAGAGALFVGPHANFRIWPNRLMALVAQHRLPASYSNGDFVRAGG
jgi:hypothetical protein